MMACPERGIVTALGSWQLALSWVKRWRRRLAVSGEDTSLSLSAQRPLARDHMDPEHTTPAWSRLQLCGCRKSTHPYHAPTFSNGNGPSPLGRSHDVVIVEQLLNLLGFFRVCGPQTVPRTPVADSQFFGQMRWIEQSITLSVRDTTPLG